MSNNKRAKNKLIELYGPECFIEKLHLRPTKQKYTGKGQHKRMQQLTFHHIIKKEHGGKATVQNGALLSAENHSWFHRQTAPTQSKKNYIFQQYKLGVLEIENGRIVNNDIINFDMSDYDVIPVYPDNSEYNRAKIKRETRIALNRYYEGGDRE